MSKMLKPCKKRKNDYIGYLMVLPAFVLFVAFVLLPAILTFRMSFYDWDLFSPEMKFVGWNNFVKLFDSEQFTTVLGNTVYFTIVTVLSKVVLGVLLASLVATYVKGKVGKFIMESSVFMPIVIPMSVVALVFNKLYDTEFGALNGIIIALGGNPVGWLTDSNVALNSVMIVDIFKGVGFFFIVSLVAIRNVPRVYYEAAEIDGASKFYQFRKITLPLIGNTVVFLFITAFISSFQIFDPIYVMLNGMFGDTKITISYMLWQQAFFYRDVGFAAVIAIVIFVIVMIMTLIQLLLSKVLVYNE